jgi:TolA-binding protein
MEWWQTAIAAVFSAAVGAAGYKFVTNYLAWRGGNYQIDKTKRIDAISELQEIIDRLQGYVDQLKAELNERTMQLSEKTQLHTDCEIRVARLETWADGVSDALAGTNIKIRPLPPRPGLTGRHEKLPPQPGGKP